LRKLIALLSTLALLLAFAPSAALAAPPEGASLRPQRDKSEPQLRNPLAEQRIANRQHALQLVLQGKATAKGANKVVGFTAGTAKKDRKAADGYRYDREKIFVELARQGEDTIWTVLGEFGDQIHPTTGGTPGPLHNQLPEPDRSVDNTNIWVDDFNVAHYEQMLFSEEKGAVSMRNFYIEQSSNRYAVNGIVEDWVSVPFNEARYGTNLCGDIVCSTVWDFVDHSVNAWYDEKIAAGWSNADVQDYLAQFDVWDRYDFDGDGNFDEPDGYIDHFQSVHAGTGEEVGGGAQGTDAIWSHRWYVNFQDIGSTGPSPDYLLGGIEIGDSNVWIGDYTIEPEDGGVGVFAHEFAHDLDVPDMYDTSGNTGGAENSTGFWTIMSSGSYGSTGKPEDGIGTKPIGFGTYEKILLDWSNYAALAPGQGATLQLGPSFHNSIYYQALVLLLPDKQVTFDVEDPFSGSWQYFSGAGNDLDNTMTRSVTLPAGSPSLTAKVNYDIETDWDYAYLTVNGTAVHTNLSTNTNPNGQNFGEGITGSSTGWIDLTADLSAFAGQTVTIGFRYWTDVAVAEPGMFIDDVAITGQALDDAETDGVWTFDGFARVGSSVVQSFFNAYFVENRVYGGYDKGLKTGPYNFGFLDDPDLQNWVEHFPYQDGMLVWYYDESFPDNSVGDHCASGRCGGLILPVDAHPRLMRRPDNGMVWRPRNLSYDSTFALTRGDRICLHANSEKRCYPRPGPRRTFNDMNSYWRPPNPAIGHFGWSSVPTPNTGTRVRILRAEDGGWSLVVRVNGG
jgi:immune inhibitor A